jgi:uncharacterized membrane protein
MKNPERRSRTARGAPAAGVAHLGRSAKAHAMSKTTERQYAFIRQRPFTALALIPAVLSASVGIAFCAGYSDSFRESCWNAFLAILLSMPTFMLLRALWKREKIRPYPLSVRRVAWKIMFGICTVMVLGALVVVVFIDAELSRKLAGC